MNIATQVILKGEGIGYDESTQNNTIFVFSSNKPNILAKIQTFHQSTWMNIFSLRLKKMNGVRN